jgi:hypothetical protein
MMTNAVSTRLDYGAQWLSQTGLDVSLYDAIVKIYFKCN